MIPEPGYRVPVGEKTCRFCGEALPVGAFYWKKVRPDRRYVAAPECKACYQRLESARKSARAAGVELGEWLAQLEPNDAFRGLDRLEGVPNFTSPSTALPRGRTEYRKWLNELLEQVYYPSLEGDGQAA